MRPIVMLLWVWVALPSSAAPTESVAQGNPYLLEALKQIRALQERAALRSLEKARTWPKNSPHEVTLYHFYSGLAVAGLGKKDKAISSFRTALIIEPDLELPEGISPRVTGWFQQAGGHLKVLAAAPVDPPAETLPTPALAPSPRPELTAAPPAPPPNAPRWRVWVGIGALAAGTLTLAAAVASGVSASAGATQARAAPALEAATQLHAEAVQRASEANILYAVGGVTAAGGGLLLVW